MQQWTLKDVVTRFIRDELQCVDPTRKILDDFVVDSIKRTASSDSVVISALYLLAEYHARESRPECPLGRGRWLLGLMLAHKGHEDDTYNGKAWAEVGGGIDLPTLMDQEGRMLEALDWKVVVPPDNFKKFSQVVNSYMRSQQYAPGPNSRPLLNEWLHLQHNSPTGTPSPIGAAETNLAHVAAYFITWGIGCPEDGKLADDIIAMQKYSNYPASVTHALIWVLGTWRHMQPQQQCNNALTMALAGYMVGGRHVPGWKQRTVAQWLELLRQRDREDVTKDQFSAHYDGFVASLQGNGHTQFSWNGYDYFLAAAEEKDLFSLHTYTSPEKARELLGLVTPGLSGAI